MEQLEKIEQERTQNAATVAELKKECDAQSDEVSGLFRQKADKAVRELAQIQKNNLYKELDHCKKIGFLLAHNWRVVAMKKCLDAFASIIKKYNGKAYGPKTAEKMKDEFKALSGGCGFWMEECGVEFYKINPCYSKIDKAYPAYNKAENKKPQLLYNNKINGDLTASDFYFYQSEYVDDIPAKLASIESKADELRKARKAYEDAQAAYRAEWVNGFDDVNRIW